MVVPTRNERDNIPGFLSSLPPEVELILVDASDDETPDLAADLRPHHTRVVRRPLRMPAARQLGGVIAQTPRPAPFPRSGHCGGVRLQSPAVASRFPICGRL
ncbi:MAG: hypothetical protein U0641_17505 [Anaerolineae bacterium]